MSVNLEDYNYLTFTPNICLLDEITRALKKKPTREFIKIDKARIYEKMVDYSLIFPLQNEFVFNLDEGNILVDGIKSYYQCLDIIENIIAPECVNLEKYVINPEFIEHQIFNDITYNEFYARLFWFYNVPYWKDDNYRLTTIILFNALIPKFYLTQVDCLDPSKIRLYEKKMLYSLYRDDTMSIQFLITSKDQATFRIEMYPSDYEVTRVQSLKEGEPFEIPNSVASVISINDINALIYRELFVRESDKTVPKSFKSFHDGSEYLVSNGIFSLKKFLTLKGWKRI